MRYAVLGGGKRVRPLLAYAAGELADADPERVDDRRGRGRADPRLLAGPRRPAVHGRRRAAARQADVPRRVRRGDRAARRRRAAGAGVRCARASAAAAMPAQRVRAARATPRARPAWRAARRSTSTPSAQALTLPELESMHRMKTGALIRAAVQLGARCGARARRRRSSRARRLRAARPASRSRWSTTCSTSKARPRRSARPPARTPRRNKPTYVSAARPRRSEAARRASCAPRRTPRSPVRRAARRLAELADWIVAAQALSSMTTIRCSKRSTIPHDLRALDASRAARSSRASCARSCCNRSRRPAATCRRTSARSSSRSRCTTCSTRRDDRIVWDVGHQTYAHKILTGRRDGDGEAAAVGRTVGLSAPRAKASTTRSAPRTRRRRSRPRSAWRSPRSSRASSAASSR